MSSSEAFDLGREKVGCHCQDGQEMGVLADERHEYAMAKRSHQESCRRER